MVSIGLNKNNSNNNKVISFNRLNWIFCFISTIRNQRDAIKSVRLKQQLDEIIIYKTKGNPIKRYYRNLPWND